MKRVMNRLPLRALAAIIFVSVTSRGISQDLTFSVHVDPIITWLGSNSADYTSGGSMAGFSMGLNVLHYFNENIAVSSGIAFLSAGGRQSAAVPHTMVFNNFTQLVAPGDEMKYNLKYINIPLGIRLQTRQIDYLTYYSDIGFDVRMLLKSTVDILAEEIRDENAKNEVYGMNAGWHLHAGVEYALNMNFSVLAGIGYDQDFFDVTKDLTDVYQAKDKSGLRMFRFRFGIKF
jgi:opacity protein-like surface antigen